MDYFLYTFLFIFGTMFGSFASVLIYRIKSREGGIIAWKSHCKTCKRDLTSLELIPILSWLLQRGECKGCRKKISRIYPFLEISMGLLFAAVGIFLVDYNLILSLDGFEWLRMLFFLTIIFLTVIYVFYDILYLEIPESILLIANITVFWSLILQDIGYNIFPYFSTWTFHFEILIISIVIMSSLYIIMLAGLKEIYDFLLLWFCIIILWWYMYFSWTSYSDSALLSGVIAALGIFISFFLQIIFSWGRAMGGGDLRIAILMGLIVWISFAFPAWMICYLIGSIIGIWILIQAQCKKVPKQGLSHQLPFGPFIASGYLTVLFFFPQISNFIAWYV